MSVSYADAAEQPLKDPIVVIHCTGFASFGELRESFESRGWRVRKGWNRPVTFAGRWRENVEYWGVTFHLRKEGEHRSILAWLEEEEAV